MKIQIGEVYMDRVTGEKTLFPNKTLKYLVPCLKEYGTNFMYKINNIFKVAIGIGDIIIDNCGFTHEKHLFLLVDSEIAKPYFKKFMTWIKDQPMYEDDYVYGNVQKSTYHMIILRFPEKFWGSLETFKKGEYSKMYDQETISKFFEVYPDVKKVLIKDHNYRIEFVTKKLNKKFGTTLSEQDAEQWEGELEFRPDNKEKFNHHLKKQ